MLEMTKGVAMFHTVQIAQVGQGSVWHSSSGTITPFLAVEFNILHIQKLCVSDLPLAQLVWICKRLAYVDGVGDK